MPGIIRISVLAVLCNMDFGNEMFALVEKRMLGEKMRSIKTKIGLLVMLGVLFSASSIGAISILNSKSVVKETSRELMEEKCISGTEQINAQLLRIEQSVITLSYYALEKLDDVTEFQTNTSYVQQYTSELSKIAVNAANNTEGALTVYIRYNPDFTSPTSGLFASRDSADHEFEKLVPTDFSSYDADDTAHVGWYYIPVKNGKPIWMSPYINENLGIEMISYVVPLNVDGVSVGVVGMDIDFGVIKNLVNEIGLYESGYAYLATQNGENIYAPSSAANEHEWEYLTKALRNDMEFVLTAPIKEINAKADDLTVNIIFLSAVGVAFALLISSIVIRSITKPLRELNQAAERISRGELDVSVSSYTKDEVGTLAESIQKTVERLHTYIAYINETAKVLKKLAQGDLVISLQQEYIGEFAPIKEALLTISNTLNEDMKQIKTAAMQITAGSEQVANGTQVISTGAMEQVGAIEQISSITHTLSQKANETTSRAEIICRLADQAGEGLDHNSEQISEMAQAMERIAADGENILHMTAIIDDIAMQTNILALNASIEAAQAGEVGKGFSVVAEEVKTLAFKTNEVAKQISGLARNTMRAIDNGKQIATETKHSVLDTVEGMHEVTNLVKNITSDSQAQSLQADQAVLHIDDMSAVVQQTLTTAQQGAASAEELSGQAQMMSEMVKKFNLT